MTPASRRNLYVDSEASAQGVGIGITLLIEEAGHVGSREAWLVCPQQAQLDSGSQIGEVLGKQIVDALRKHQPVQVEGVRLVAYTEIRDAGVFEWGARAGHHAPDRPQVP